MAVGGGVSTPCVRTSSKPPACIRVMSVDSLRLFKDQSNRRVCVCLRPRGSAEAQAEAPSHWQAYAVTVVSDGLRLVGPSLCLGLCHTAVSHCAEAPVASH
eukprot:1003399-Rhodomonas_salina.1